MCTLTAKKQQQQQKNHYNITLYELLVCFQNAVVTLNLIFHYLIISLTLHSLL